MDNKLKDFLNKNDCFFIHYASSGFYNGTSPAPKISCIILCDSKFDQTYTFNISNYLNKETKDTLDAERKLIYDFISFIKNHPDMRLIHWNMNLEGFGFNAIRKRAEELNIKLPVLLEDNLFDLSSYVSYLAGKRLSIKQILWFNSLLYGNNYLDGKEEAEYFNKGRFEEISNSVNLKVHGLKEVVNLIRENKLKIELTYQSNDGLTREERRAQAIKLAQAREQMINDIMEHNKRVLEEQETVYEEETFLFFDSEHPFLSLFASWLGSG